MKIKAIVSFVIALYLLGNGAQAATVIDPSDSNIQYTGRWDFSDPSAPWSQAKASSIIVNFQGTSIGIDLTGNSSDWVRAIIDDDAAGSVKIPLVNGVINLASGLSDSTHKLEFVKENDQGKMLIYGLHLDNGKSLSAPPARPSRRIEFYGDSNQAGYSLESEQNQGGSNLQGAYYTYPGIVARMFDAEHVNFSKSGATITSLDTAHTRTDWDSSSPQWDFNDFQADLVVVNIGANDSGPTRRLKVRYHNLLDDLRAEQPNAHIMLYNAYGWDFGEPANFIHEVIADRSDPNMSSMVFPWVFAQYHGCEYDHGGMAMVLAEHVESVMGWTAGAQDVMSGFGVDGDVANGSFELVAPFGAWGWRYYDDSGVSRKFDPSGAFDGDYYLRLANGASSQQTNPADSGETYTVTAWIRGQNNGDQVDITIDFRDQGMGAGEVSPIVAFTDTKTLTTGWQEYSFAATAPTSGNPVYATRVTFTAASGDSADIDAVILSTGSTPDTNPPTPDPMTWASVPAASGDTSITMIAATAADPSGVEYYFSNTSGAGNDSGWQDSSFYTDNGLQPDTSYGYAVMARDKSGNQNTTASSTTQSATTTGGGGCTPASMHVSNIQPGTARGSQGQKFGAVAVTIQDNCGNAVTGTDVSGSFTGDYNETIAATTNASGVATLTTLAQVKKPAYGFCVDSVTGTLTYASGDNVETCDSL